MNTNNNQNVDEHMNDESAVEREPGASQQDRSAELEAALADRDAKLREAVALYENEKAMHASSVKRLERDSIRKLETSKEDFFRSFLEVLDDVDRAVAAADESTREPSLAEGMRLLANRFDSKLREHGVQRQNSSGRFDPKRHEAVATVDVNRLEQDGEIVDVVRPGYTMGERLLRPALVTVGAYAASSSPELTDSN